MKKWISVVGISLSVLAMAIGVYLVQRPKETKKSKAAAATQISVTPSTISKSNNETFIVNVDIDTGENTVSAVDLEVDYDPAKLEGLSMTAGTYLPVVLSAGQVGTGKAKIILGSQPTDPKQGTGTLATIEFKAIGDNTSTEIFVSENTKVAAIGEGGNNVLAGRNPSTVTIGAPASIEPTASPTALPTQEPTPLPTDTPTGVPTATPTQGPGGTSGDVNDDGVVNIVDIGIIIDNYGLTPPADSRADINGDGVVNVVDIGIVIDNYQ